MAAIMSACGEVVQPAGRSWVPRGSCGSGESGEPGGNGEHQLACVACAGCGRRLTAGSATRYLVGLRADSPVPTATRSRDRQAIDRLRSRRFWHAAGREYQLLAPGAPALSRITARRRAVRAAPADSARCSPRRFYAAEPPAGRAGRSTASRLGGNSSLIARLLAASTAVRAAGGAMVAQRRGVWVLNAWSSSVAEQ